MWSACINTKMISPGGEAYESTAVQSVQVEEGERTAACHVSGSWADSLPWHKWDECERDLCSWIQQKLLRKEWYVLLCHCPLVWLHLFYLECRFLTFWFLHSATVYGQGVYFAVNSALSVQDQYSPPNADGYKFILVSKVLTGDYTKGCHSMKTAPLKETGNIPLRYDSVTDDITKPTMFVIFNDTQAFPEYLITCQRIHRWGISRQLMTVRCGESDFCFNVYVLIFKKCIWFYKGLMCCRVQVVIILCCWFFWLLYLVLVKADQ